MRGAEDFDRLWAEHHRRVLAYALRRTDAGSAQDIVSETFLTAWRRRAEMPADALPWLLGVARRVLANHTRSQRRRDALARVLIDSAIERYEDVGEVDTSLLWAMAELSETDREVLTLVAWDGFEVTEAARVLGCSPVAARLRLMRARRNLRALLEGENGDLPVVAEVRV